MAMSDIITWLQGLIPLGWKRQGIRNSKEQSSFAAVPIYYEAECETCQWFGQGWNATPREGCTMNPVHEKPTATNCWTYFPGRGLGKDKPHNRKIESTNDNI